MLGQGGKVTWVNYVQAIMKYGDESDKEYLIQQLTILGVLAFVTILFTFLMVQLFAFMDKGKKVVITGDSFYRLQSKAYLYQDKKPRDFDSRLAAILEREHELPELYAKHTF